MDRHSSEQPETPAPDVAILLRRLGTAGRKEHEAAAAELAALGVAAAGPLCACLGEELGVRRSRAAAVLVRIGPVVLPELAAVQLSGSDGARLWAAWVLSRLEGEGVTPMLCRAAADPDRRVRRQALEGLRLRRDPGAAPLLREALRDPDPALRRLAAEALGQLESSTSAAVPLLIEALRDEDLAVRAGAAAALGAIGDRRAVAPLVQCLRDAGWGPRWTAAAALGRIGDARAVPALCECLRDGERDARFRTRAAEALGMLGAAALPDLAAVLERGSQEERELALDAIARVGRPAVACLCAALQSPEAAVRILAARGLERLATAAPCPELRTALPPLRRLVSPLAMSAPGSRFGFIRALAAVERATREMRHLPLPAVPPPAAAADALPLPAAEPDPSFEAPAAPPRSRTWLGRLLGRRDRK